MTTSHKKVLFFDPVCLEGHLNFNRIQISALISQGFQIDICATNDYYLSLECNDVNLIYEIPKGEIIVDKGGFKYRWSMIKVLFKIRNNVILSNYDAVIISCYDEIALSLSFFPSSYIINHNNLCYLNNPIKRFFFNRVTKKHQHIVLCDSGKKYIEHSFHNSKVYRIQHGLPKKISGTKKNSGKFTIFSPSKSSTDKISTQKLIYNPDFINWLKCNNAQFIVRGDFVACNECNIKIIHGVLSKEEYSNLFINADCIFISYPEFFKYRVSAVLYECLANNKPFVIFDLPEFSEYKNILNENLFFKNFQTLISSLDWIRLHENEISFPDKFLNEFKPDYTFLRSK